MKEQFLLIPSIYLKILIETAMEFRISKSEIVKKCQIPMSFLNDTSLPEYINFNEWIRIISFIIDLIGEKGISYKLGLNCRATSHGALGFAMISNNNIGNVLLDLQKFINLRLHKVELNIINRNDKILIRITPTYHLNNDFSEEKKEKINKFLIECAIINIVSNLQSITAYQLTNINIDLKWKKSDYHQFFEKKIPPINFNKEYNQIIFDLKYLDFPLNFSSKNAYNLAINLVQQEYILSKEKDSNIIIQVNKLLKLTPGSGFPSLTEIAAKLKKSERTLKRDLTMANTTFSSLVKTKKFETSKQLIDANKTIQEISNILGYSHISAFSRAFIEWTGKKPSDYIREQHTIKKDFLVSH
jgi:AraC-like DNA-binding protein